MDEVELLMVYNAAGLVLMAFLLYNMPHHS